MRKYLLLLAQLICLDQATAANDIVLYPNGVSRPGIYIPGFRTYSANPYSPSAENVALLREFKQAFPPMRIAGFSSYAPGEASLVCRLSYPVYLPGKIPYEAYLAEAMRAELLEAGLYAEDASVGINGHLVAMDFNSFGTGKWTIEATFSIDGKEPIAIKHEYTYSVAAGAVRACNDVSRALVPAMQDFLHAVYSNPQFKDLLR
ncbi:MAG: hypothetical protein H6R10_2341 [Rhodocyclaceae bacterium]|nr:hypothetical protein [Rhodocyclaceae bacterium]